MLVDHVRQVERRVVRHRGRHGRRRHRRREQGLGGLNEHPVEPEVQNGKKLIFIFVNS